MKPEPQVDALGDRGLLVRWPGRPSRSLGRTLGGFAALARELEGVVDAAPGHRTVLVEAEPRARDAVAALLPALVADAGPIEGTRHRVSIRYDGEDLGWVCARLGLARDELVRLHSSRTYDVRLLGSPGFVYLSPVHAKIAVPRLEGPRPFVPAGSVGIAGRQTGIYGRPRPGGWRLIGTVDDLPALRPGDRVRFHPA